MKKSLLIALLIIPFLGFSQTTKPIDGFLGIKFGTTRAAALVAFKAKGAILDKDNSNATTLAFDNVKVGGRKADAVFVYLVDDKVYNGTFIFKPVDQPQTVDYYNNLVNDINTSYGKGTPTREFKSPFKYGDGHEIIAIQEGYARMFTDWQSDKNSIQVLITHKEDDLSVGLIYEDSILAAQAEAKEKAKDKSDL